MPVADAALAEGLVIAPRPLLHRAIGTDRMDVDAITERVFLHQQPLLLGTAVIDDCRMEPERPGAKPERRLAFHQGLETPLRQFG